MYFRAVYVLGDYDMSEVKSDKKASKGFSKLLFIEVLVLLIGLAMSIYYTCSILKYDAHNAWFFRFAVVDIIFIIVTLVVTKKNKIVGGIIGGVFIFAFLLYGGYGAVCCMAAGQRMEHLSYYNGKEVCAEVDGVRYVWDGESVTYSLGKDSNAEAVDKAEHNVVLSIDNQESAGVLYDDDYSDEYVYFQIHGGGTGEWLILEKD